ncbi:MAG: hypothetical protein ABSH41_01635 [Syntrophobacteraceae bacterium]
MENNKSNLTAEDALRMQHECEQEFGDCTDLSEEKKTRFLGLAAELLKKRWHTTTLQIFESGRVLSLVERLLPGGWTDWVLETKILKLRTAHNYKNVYKACCGRPEIVGWHEPTTKRKK